ncbi:MAG: hypothetical protein QM504_10140 [Pseudomonadota bacterium]
MKTFDKNEVFDLIEKINAQLKKRKINRKDIHLSRKQINIIKFINPKLQEVIYGSWSGYGYDNLGRFIIKENFINIKRKLLKLKTKETIKNVINPIQAWINRLSKLTGLSNSECESIAGEKINYKQEKIQEVEDRQNEQYSVKRQKLINKMERENPLRYIKNEEHANAILAAHDRHSNTDYEVLLNEGRYQAMIGNINRGEVKDYARQRI